MSGFPDQPRTFEEFARESTVLLVTMLQVINDLVSTQADLLEVVEGMSRELEALTASVGVPTNAEQARRRAADLSSEAARLQARARGLTAPGFNPEADPPAEPSGSA